MGQCASNASEQDSAVSQRSSSRLILSSADAAATVRCKPGNLLHGSTRTQCQSDPPLARQSDQGNSPQTHNLATNPSHKEAKALLRLGGSGVHVRCHGTTWAIEAVTPAVRAVAGAASLPQYARLLQAILDWDSAAYQLFDTMANEVTAHCSQKIPSHRPTMLLVYLPSKVLHTLNDGLAPANHIPKLHALSMHALPAHSDEYGTAWANASQPCISVQHHPISISLESSMGLSHQPFPAASPSQDSAQAPELTGLLSTRYCRTLAALDAVPGMLSICTMAGQILSQNQHALLYTGSAAIRAAASQAGATVPGEMSDTVKVSSSYWQDLLQLQPELLDEMLGAMVDGKPWTNVVKVPVSLVPSPLPGSLGASSLLDVKATASPLNRLRVASMPPGAVSWAPQTTEPLEGPNAGSAAAAPEFLEAQPMVPYKRRGIARRGSSSWLAQTLTSPEPSLNGGSHSSYANSANQGIDTHILPSSQVRSFDDHRQAPTGCLESSTPEPRKPLQSIQALGVTYDQTGQCLPGIAQPARQHAETPLPVQLPSFGKTGPTSRLATYGPAPSMLPIPPPLPTAASFPCGPPTGPNLNSGLHSGFASTVPRGLKRSTTFSAGSNAQFALPIGSVDGVNSRLGQGTGQAASGLRQRLLALLEHSDRMVSGSSSTPGPEPPLAAVTVQAATGTPMGHKAGYGKQAGDSQMDDTCMHEVCVTPFRDPETGTMLFMVQQQDVSARSKLEQRLVALSEGQLAMLDSMFPRHILERISELCGGGESGPSLAAIKDLNCMATHHDCVTIMFTDIVGFTSMSKECKPEQVMEFLNELFSYLDAMLDKHKVHKVETAGDCYIICGGIVDEDEQGFRRVTGKLSASARTRAARRALNFAYDMMQVARRVLMPNNGQPVTLRAGIHSGPVVSGLIGRRVPKFSLFGDTMNTASRMESTSIPGCIQISEATYKLLQDDPQRWQATGGVEVKGKGTMQTYLLEQQLAPRHQQPAVTSSPQCPGESPSQSASFSVSLLLETTAGLSTQHDDLLGQHSSAVHHHTHHPPGDLFLNMFGSNGSAPRHSRHTPIFASGTLSTTAERPQLVNSGDGTSRLGVLTTTSSELQPQPTLEAGLALITPSPIPCSGASLSNGQSRHLTAVVSPSPSTGQLWPMPDNGRIARESQAGQKDESGSSGYDSSMILGVGAQFQLPLGSNSHPLSIGQALSSFSELPSMHDLVLRMSKASEEASARGTPSSCISLAPQQHMQDLVGPQPSHALPMPPRLHAMMYTQPPVLPPLRPAALHPLPGAKYSLGFAGWPQICGPSASGVTAAWQEGSPGPASSGAVQFLHAEPVVRSASPPHAGGLATIPEGSYRPSPGFASSGVSGESIAAGLQAHSAGEVGSSRPAQPETRSGSQSAHKSADHYMDLVQLGLRPAPRSPRSSQPGHIIGGCSSFLQLMAQNFEYLAMRDGNQGRKQQHLSTIVLGPATPHPVVSDFSNPLFKDVLPHSEHTRAP